MIQAVFVYGTLKRGQERARCWPRQPLRVAPAETRGQLYDLGPYPALVPGTERVLGELWFLAEVDVAETLRVLDKVECYGIEEVDLYVRRVVECRTLDDDECHSAYVYFLADESYARQHSAVTTRADGFLQWLPRM